MNAQQIPGQDAAAVPAKTTNVNVYEQPAAPAASSGVNIQTIAIIAAVVIAVILLINMIS
ncbi:MAG: hypothetical protein V4642_01855 [Bacteroidota bacterium]